MSVARTLFLESTPQKNSLLFSDKIIFMPIKLIVYPEFENKYQAADILNRIAWGLTGAKVNGNDVIVYSQNAFEIDNSGCTSQFYKPYINTSQESYLDNLPDVEVPGKKFDPGPNDFILVWDAQAELPDDFHVTDEHTIFIDPNLWFNYEADQVASLRYAIMDEAQRTKWRDNSRNLYEVLAKKWENVRDAYLYLTGPTVESVHERIIDRNGLHVICNSLVKNITLLEKIKPDILMFSDPAYHFGVSRYATSFRNYAKNCMQLFPGLVCIVPEKYAPITTGFLGREFNQRVIGIPVVESNTFNFPTATNFSLRKTANILTLAMVPVASAFAKNIHILGADGRATQDKGYWSHAKSSQIGDQMKTIYDSHPSLGRDEDVEQYYRDHCELLEAQLSWGEAYFQKNYICDTPSNIPALKKRSVYRSMEA